MFQKNSEHRNSIRVEGVTKPKALSGDKVNWSSACKSFFQLAALALLLMIPVGTALAANEPSHTISSLPSGVLPISDYYNQSFTTRRTTK